MDNIDPMKTTKKNIQQIIDIINNNEIKSTKEISEMMNINQTNVSYNIRRINYYEKEKIIWKGKDKIYHTKIKKIEELKFIQEVEKLIKAYLEKPEIIKWQNKNISLEYNTTEKAVYQFRAYIQQGTKEQLMPNKKQH